MTTEKKGRDITVEELKRLRDELRVQMHLASAEAREEWEQLEEKWKGLNIKLRSVGDAATRSLDEIGEAAKATVQEIGNAYERIKKAL